MNKINIIFLLLTVFCGCNSDNDIIGEAPSTPILVSPANESIFDIFPRTTFFKWNPAQGVGNIKYTFQLQYSWRRYLTFGSWNEGDFAMQKNITITNTQYTINFTGAQPGRWRVNAKNEFGTSEWSEWWYFLYLK